ncbi:hypothetical protein GTY65_18100 [Streptomyces sp. SID8379]|uniref:hypothetical protein n=1 Tax=unclassified Streptomyces TaxID=2593676 RepID=UPI00037D3963|nr:MULTISPECIES: hypothetical protein [unclassified Streptomyces]MYW65953.1 hypothetical protein [Streptomyces sp. SID8379]
MKFSEVLSWPGLKSWLSGPDPHAVARAARELAGSALPAGERVVDSHVVAIGEGVPLPPYRLRPEAFPAARSATDRGLDRVAETERVLDRLNPFNAAVGALDGRGGGAEPGLVGGWESAAGRLGRVLQPREAHAASVLLLGDRGVHVVHVRKSPDGRQVEPGPHYAWGAPRASVVWFRERGAVKHGTHELGFDDGSWVRVFFPVAGWGTLAKALGGGQP